MLDQFLDLRILIREVIHSKGDIIVYHASPQLHLKQLMPRFSPKFGKKGVFVSSSITAMWESWITWAMRKPDKTKTGRTFDDFENVAVYKIHIPRSVFDEAQARHEEAAKGGSFGAWGWDIETFIPEELMIDGHLTPSSVKVYTRSEVMDIISHHHSWKTAGIRPKDNEINGGSKNPARAALKKLRQDIIDASLARGGRIGSVDYANPEKELKEIVASIEKLAIKTRLSSLEKENLKSLLSSAEELIKIPVKEVQPKFSVVPTKYKYGTADHSKNRLTRRQKANMTQT